MVLSVKTDPQTVEAISNFFFEMGAQGVEEKDDALEATFPGEMSAQEIRQSVNDYLTSLKQLGFAVFPETISLQRIQDKDWNAEWKKNYHAIRITENILIKPSWEEQQDEAPKVVIKIDPEMAFGTGTHETTRLCLQLLEETIRPNARILDVGTGTGILAIAAIKLGAGLTFAFDIDPVAVHTARANAVKNGAISRLYLFTGTISALSNTKFDLVLANVNRTQIENMLNDFYRLTSPNSQLIISGILKDEDERITEQFLAQGFTVLYRKTEGEWIAYKLGRK